MRAGTGGVCVGDTDCKTMREAWEVCGRLGYAERRKRKRGWEHSGERKEGLGACLENGN